MHVILATHLHYEPDLCFITNQRRHIVKEKFIDGPPDLIVEVISESNRTHDTVVKFRNYAQHGVTEYWLVDPRDNEISTWRLEGDGYVLLGRARPADRVVTDVLSGLELDPGSVLPIQSPNASDESNLPTVRQIPPNATIRQVAQPSRMSTAISLPPQPFRSKHAPSGTTR